MVVVRTKMGDKRTQRTQAGSVTLKNTARQTDRQTAARGRAEPGKSAPHPGFSPPAPPPRGIPGPKGATAKRVLPRNTLQSPPPTPRQLQAVRGEVPVPRSLPLLPPRDGKRWGETGQGTGDQAAIPPPHPPHPPSPAPAPASRFWRLRVTGKMPPVPPGSVGTPSLLLTSASLTGPRGEGDVGRQACL